MSEKNSKINNEDLNYTRMKNKKKLKLKIKEVCEDNPTDLKSIDNLMDLTNLVRKHTDLYDLVKIRYLLSLTDAEWKKNFSKKYKPTELKQKVKMYRNLLTRILEDGENEVEREYTLRTCNRLYCSGGIQILERNLRNFIQDSRIKDYDMINAMPSILLYLTKNAGLPYENLEHFCKNREEILKKFDSNRDIAKSKVNALFYTDKPKPTKVIEVNGMIQEYMDNRSVLIHTYSSNINPDREDDDDSRKNPLGSKMSSILCWWENVVLNSVLNKFPSKSINTLIFDGFYSTLDIPIEQLNQMTEEYGIKWKSKPLETCYKLPDDFNPMVKMTYKEMKEKFEASNCFLTFTGHFKVRNEINGNWESMKHDTMKRKYMNWRTVDEEGNDCEFYERWMKDTDRIDYNQMAFKPYSLEKYNFTHPLEFNIFRGFARNNLCRTIEDSEVQWFIDFLRTTYGFEEESGPDFVRFLIRYYARIIQKPHKKIHCIMVLRGYEGTGKDTIKYIFGRLMGKDYIYECKGMREIITKGAWNDHLVDKIICVMNEADCGDAVKNVEDLKHKATSTDLNVFERFCSQQTVEDLNNMIVNSNNIFCACISPTDRRYCVLITNEDLHGNKAFWTELYENIEDDDKMDLLYTWLLQQDIEDFDFMEERPITEAFKKLAVKNIPECYQVLYKLLMYHIKENGNTRWRMRCSYFNSCCEYTVKHILEKNYDCKKSKVAEKMDEIPFKYLMRKKEVEEGHGAPTFYIVENPLANIERFDRLEFKYHDGDSEVLDPLLEFVQQLD